MPTHHFTLIVDGADLQDESVIDRLFEAGCDDALVGSADGVQFIDFDRDAASLDVAVLSAVADVEQVGGVQVVRLANAGSAINACFGTTSRGPSVGRGRARQLAGVGGSLRACG